MLGAILKDEKGPKDKKKEEKPSFDVGFDELPEVKDWQLGQEYTIRVKQVMKDNKYKRAGFEIVGVNNNEK